MRTGLFSGRIASFPHSFDSFDRKVRTALSPLLTVLTERVRSRPAGEELSTTSETGEEEVDDFHNINSSEIKAARVRKVLLGSELSLKKG